MGLRFSGAVATLLAVVVATTWFVADAAAETAPCPATIDKSDDNGLLRGGSSSTCLRRAAPR